MSTQCFLIKVMGFNDNREYSVNFTSLTVAAMSLLNIASFAQLHEISTNGVQILRNPGCCLCIPHCRVGTTDRLNLQGVACLMQFDWNAWVHGLKIERKEFHYYSARIRQASNYSVRKLFLIMV